MSALTDEWRAKWRARLAQQGQLVIVRRLPLTDAAVNAAVRGFKPDELTSGIVQGDREVIVMAEDLEAAPWPTPPARGDKIILLSGGLRLERGGTVDVNSLNLAGARFLHVESVDIDSMNLAGVDIGYKMVVRG